MNRYNISTPEGTRDLLFASCRALRSTENAIRETLERKGYSEIITPAVEYYDVFAQANPELDQESMLKIVDKSGRICVARPDNTTPIARIAATRLDDVPALPVRLYYSQKVFRSVSGDHGHKGEFLQIGAELIGADGLHADLDILSAAFEALRSTGADNFRIELGHAEIYKALIEALGVDAAAAESIRRLIENKSFAALGDVLAPFGSKPEAKALYAMPQLFGGVEVLDEVEVLTGNVRVLGAISYLRRLYKALDEAGFGGMVMIDLGLVHEMDYYTGIMFRGYCGGAGAAILSGGRYNALCAKFGKDMPAGGFGIDVESVAESLTGKGAETAPCRDSVRIALTKGRLEKKTLALLKASGYDISELEAGSRKLIFTLPDTNIEIVLAKAADVITYVEHGVCDMGVVGKDTIMEKGGSFYEMVDLGFGKCRFALATKKGKQVYGSYKTPVIATKYPNVTRSFFARKNMDVENIKIEGSVELAPLLELADAIVDIVETGSTLKENGLEVIEDVAPISARVIVNLASAKMKKAAIEKVIAELEQGLEKE